MTVSLKDFALRVAEVRARHREFEDVLREVTPFFRDLLHAELLPAPLLHPTQHSVLRYILYRSEAVTVFAMASPRGFSSPIHDHGSWGLVGQVVGEELETTFRSAPADRELFDLQPSERRRMRPGDVVEIVPPHRDLHRVTAVSERPSVTLHAFARDPVHEGFTYFEPQLYRPVTYQGSYDNEDPSA